MQQRHRKLRCTSAFANHMSHQQCFVFTYCFHQTPPQRVRHICLEFNRFKSSRITQTKTSVAEKTFSHSILLCRKKHFSKNLNSLKEYCDTPRTTGIKCPGCMRIFGRLNGILAHQTISAICARILRCNGCSG